MKSLWKYTKEDWEKINLAISIISGLFVIGTLIPVGLSLYLNSDWLYNRITTTKIERFNAKGYTFYKPIYKKMGDNTAYYLLKEIENKQPTYSDSQCFIMTEPKTLDMERDSFCNLVKGDILATATNSYLREKGDLTSRVKYVIKEGQCVQVLDTQKRVPVPETEKERQGGYIYVGLTSCPTSAPN